MLLWTGNQYDALLPSKATSNEFMSKVVAVQAKAEAASSRAASSKAVAAQTSKAKAIIQTVSAKAKSASSRAALSKVVAAQTAKVKTRIQTANAKAKAASSRTASSRAASSGALSSSASSSTNLGVVGYTIAEQQMQAEVASSLRTMADVARSQKNQLLAPYTENADMQNKMFCEDSAWMLQQKTMARLQDQAHDAWTKYEEALLDRAGSLRAAAEACDALHNQVPASTWAAFKKRKREAQPLQIQD